jgi:hypothetical protein
LAAAPQLCPQTAWEGLFSDFQDRLAVLQDEAGDGKSLAWGIKKFTR